MPSRGAKSYGIPAVAAFKGLLDELLQRAHSVKPSSSIEPALKRPDFEDLQTQLREVFPTAEPAAGKDKGDNRRARRFAIIETAARDTLSTLIVGGQRDKTLESGTSLLTPVGYHLHRVSRLC